jgi:hypothetical protein
MAMQAIMEKISKGVFYHISQDDSESNDVDRAQMVISILCEVLGEETTRRIEESKTGSEDMRSFLRQCGFSQKTAEKVINDDNDPFCIY